MGSPVDGSNPLDTSFHGRRQRQRLADPDFEGEYLRSRRRIAQIDAVMQRLDTLRAEAGLSKAELARRIGKEPATVRRLFSSQVNPTLETVMALADELGASVQVVAANTANGLAEGGNKGG
jgi:ribosome-binding protein aMBF1 (putative translation factor)